MKSKFLLVFFLCFLSLPLSIGNAGEEKFKLDGYKWAEMSRQFKLGFVEGWLRGGVVASVTPVFAALDLFSKEISRLSIEEFEKLKERTMDIVRGCSKEKGLGLFDITYGQIVDTIDKVYTDPRVKTWEIEEIMPLVGGRLKEGWTEKDLDEVISYLIKQKEFSKKWEKWVNYRSMSESERKKFLEEVSSLEEPKVLKALRSYRFE